MQRVHQNDKLDFILFINNLGMFLHQALPKDIQGPKRQLYQINRKPSPKHNQQQQLPPLISARKNQTPSLDKSRSHRIKSSQKPQMSLIQGNQLPTAKQISSIPLRRNPLTPQKSHLAQPLILSQRIERQSFEGDFSEEPRIILCSIENKTVRNFSSPFSYFDLSSIKPCFLLRYEGSTKGNRIRHGFGTQWFSNGQKFVGTFEGDNAEGHGTYYGLRKKIIGWWQKNILKQVFVEI